MIIGILFYLVLIINFIVSLSYGESFDKKLSLSLIVISIFSYFISISITHDQFNIFIAISDAILLVIILIHSFHGNRYWPLWFAAFHSLAVISDILIIASPNLLAPYDWALAGVWALPALLSMSIGIVLDHRAGLNED